MKTIAALFGSMLHLIDLINMVISKSSTIVDQTLNVAVDLSAMAEAGSTTARKSFNAENLSQLKELQKDLDLSDEEFNKL